MKHLDLPLTIRESCHHRNKNADFGLINIVISMFKLEMYHQDHPTSQLKCTSKY